MAPRDPQGIHKQAAESLFRVYAARHGFAGVSLRLGNCYGPRQPTQGRDIGLVGGFIRQLLEGAPVEIYGNPATRSRQLVYVRDVAAWVVHLAETFPSGFHAMNLAGPKVLLRDLADTLTSMAGGTYSFRPFPEDIKALDCGDGEMDQSRLRKLWPDFAFSDWRKCLETTYAYFKAEFA
jgi:UDP-glucose 4-epimerase